MLLDPAAARARAEAVAATDPREAAEIRLLLRDPRGALAALGEDAGSDDPRTIRLVADAHTALVHGPEGDAALDRLAEHPGWGKHSRQTRAYLRRAEWAKLGRRLGLAAFAVGLAILALGGARELLRVQPETLVVGALTAAAVGLVAASTPALAPIAAVLGLGTLALSHAATALVRRTRPGVRGRLLTATLLVLGAAGVATALVLQIGVGPLLGVLGSAGG